MTLTPENEALARILIDGAQRTFRNGDELFIEAQILASHGAITRAFFLHQISLEECGKIEMICAATTELLQGGTVNIKPLAKAFTRHESKNKSNAYFLPRTEEEDTAFGNNDTAAAVAAFAALQNEFHQDSNTLKNASLYVKFDDKFSSPSDVITKEKLESIVQRNVEFLSLTKPKIDMLSRWNMDLSSGAAQLAEMFSALGLDKLKAGPPTDVRAFFEDLSGKISSLADVRREQPNLEK